MPRGVVVVCRPARVRLQLVIVRDIDAGQILEPVARVAPNLSATVARPRYLVAAFGVVSLRDTRGRAEADWNDLALVRVRRTVLAVSLFVKPVVNAGAEPAHVQEQPA